MKNNIKFVDGHYELPLPFREKLPQLVYNREYVVKKANSIKQRMLKDKSFHDEYVEFVMKLIRLGYARKVKSCDLQDKSGWWIPHHGVYHPSKGTLRVVNGLQCSI